MKTILITMLILLTMAGLLRGQTTYYYGYDDAGNRTTRTITLFKSSQNINGNEQQLSSPRDSNNIQQTSIQKDGETEQQIFTDKLGEQNILIYPNPVKSTLKIEIQGYQEGTSASIMLYDQTGRLIYAISKVTIVNLLDLSYQSPGIYFMDIRIGKETIQWKIIKE